MPYVITWSELELRFKENELRIKQRLTKSRPRDMDLAAAVGGPPLVLLVEDANGPEVAVRSRRLAWIGVIAHHGTIGVDEKSITVDPLRECIDQVALDGPDGLLSTLPRELRREFDEATLHGGVGVFGNTLWQALENALRARAPQLNSLLDWLLAQANPPSFEDSPADRAWQEQRDATGTLLRIGDFPLSALAAWRRPPSDDDPYTAGLIPQPLEQSLIDYDVRVAGEAFGLISEWQWRTPVRCDIHQLYDPAGHRRLEVVSVNAGPVEARFGTDMVYYHEPTESFVMVQYKRLDPVRKSIHVDKRLRSQLDRLEATASLSRPPKRPHEWRLGGDPCFVKLAYWPQNARTHPVQGLAPGMYLPVSYLRLLLKDDRTRGRRGNDDTRVLGYDTVERHFTGTQFIDLVKHGLVGTVGTSREQLSALIRRRVEDGHNVLVGMEWSEESVRDRQARTRDRGAKKKTYLHRIHRQAGL